MKKISLRLFCAGVLFAFFACGVTNTYADGWVIKAISYSRSHAEASVPGSAEIDDSGLILFGQSSAKATAATATAFAQATAMSKNLWGGNLKTTTQGAGAVAGPTNPFVNPIEVHVGPGLANLDYDVSFSPGVITINGTAEFNANGFLELAVLNVNGLSPEFVSSLLADFGSIERAVAMNAISADRVLLINREGGSLLQNGSFSVSVNLGSIDPNDIVVTGLAHSVSDVPEPAAIFLLGTGLTALALKIRNRR